MWPIRRVSQGIPIAIEAACLTSKEVLAMGLAGQGLQWRQRGCPGQVVIPSASLVLPDPQTTEGQLGFVLLAL